VIEFQTAGLTKEDGSDIRVLCGGRVVPHKLYGIGPGDKATIAFEIQSERRTYFVYFGDADAEAPPGDWEPQRGLVLETRRFDTGTPRDLRRMRAILDRAGPFYGAGPVDKIWHGHNVFGLSERFVSRYIGWFFAGASGRYHFATSSDDASFLLVDGKQVVAWPGWHGPVADARHNGAVDLRRGLHRIEYLHVNRGGSTCAVAAWRPPWAETFEVMAPSVFAPLARAVVGPLELQDRAAAPDFEYGIMGEALLLEDRPIHAVKVLLSSRTKGAGNVHWEFGDGLSGRGPSVSHVYLAEGIYEVTMRLGADDGAPFIRQRIRVHRDWRRQFQKEIDDISDYYPVISKYDPEKLESRSLLQLTRLLANRGSRGFVKSTVLAMVRRSGEMKSWHLEYALNVLRKTMGAERIASDAEVTAALAESLERTEGDEKAVLALVLADLLLEIGRADTAALHLQNTLLAEPGPGMKRRLLVRYADAARYEGHRDAAKRALEAAAAVQLPSSAVRESALAGALALSIEDFLRTRDYQSAERALSNWDFASPLDKLAGYNPYLRGRLYLAQGRRARAVAELESIPAVSPESPWAPKALLAVAEVLLAEGNKTGALEVLGRIEGEYRTSPERDEAADLSKRIGFTMKGGA
jgi:TolA-binding protein